jgi:wyosine [tRNA(Phe)-imidazoG37] synthetase (radical SAM superfamily)
MLCQRFSSISANTRLPRLIRPQEPTPEECCNSDCEYCVTDLYQEKLKEYADELQKRRSLPNHKLTNEEEQFLKDYFSNPSKASSPKSVAQDAFDQLEKSLQSK